MSERDQDWVDCTKIAISQRKARKEHRCTCGGKIPAGDFYYREVYLVDGQISVTKIGDHIHNYEREE